MPVYELLAPRDRPAASGADAPVGNPPTDIEARIAGYDAAFTHYLARRWSDSEKLLLELSKRFAQDDAFAALLARVRHYAAHPPPPEWDGVYVSDSK